MSNPIRASFVCGHPSLRSNRIFSDDPGVMRDACSSNWIELRNRLDKLGVQLSTDDIHPPEESALVIKLDVHPRLRRRRGGSTISYLFLSEPPTVYPPNWDPAAHGDFDRVFTWDESVVDNHKYFLLRWAWDLSVEFGEKSYHDRKLCTMIVSFKRSTHPQNLYAERLRTVRWFSDNRPNEFDLYGQRWPQSFRPPLPSRVETRLPAIARRAADWFFPKNSVYRGTVFSKRETLRQYKFSFCYENMRDQPGYVTEKIFDSMCAGCVPVYWGASNINDLVDPRCFIDRRSFQDTAEVFEFLISVNEDQFRDYQEAGRQFLNGSLSTPFRPGTFADTIIDHVVTDLALSR